ncbi:uncharacterized protein LOC141646789 [Silene latifolia]|uniref:uncharacterized protein LOC141646789 n=1 Tax=Silene latifolia TaxID=37657 RepID=UPI003D7894AE
MMFKRKFVDFGDGQNENNHNDSGILLRELHDGEFAKHRSCWRHVAAYRQGCRGKMSEMEMKLIKWRFGPCFSNRVCRKRSERRSKQPALPRLKMSDAIFNDHLENLWRSLPEDKKATITHVESWCFYLYLMKRPKAMELIKRKDIFSKKYSYVFVPIVCWDHWRLIIFCHFGEDAYSKTRTRCILLLDSSESCAEVIGPEVRKFVFDIFKAESRPESKETIYRIPLIVPKVPQQTNEVDCGRFVLYFMKLFIDAAPRNFSMSNGYPYFLKPDWFDPASFSKFCDNLERDIPTHKQGNCAPRRVSQRIRNTRTSSRRKVEVITVVD